MMEHSFPGDGWTLASPWEVVNEFIILLCLCVQLLVSLLNCPWLKLQIFSLLLFQFSPWSCWWVSEWAGMWGLVAGWGETRAPSLFHDSPMEISVYLTSGRIHLPCREGFGTRNWFSEYQRLYCHMEDSRAGITGPAASSLTPGFFHIHHNYGDVT